VWGTACIGPCFLDLGTSWRWVVSFTPNPLHLRGKRPGTHRMGELQSRSWRYREINIFYPIGTRTPTLQSFKPYTVVIPTGLQRLLALRKELHKILKSGKRNQMKNIGTVTTDLWKTTLKYNYKIRSRRKCQRSLKQGEVDDNEMYNASSNGCSTRMRRRICGYLRILARVKHLRRIPDTCWSCSVFLPDLLVTGPSCRYLPARLPQ
jgi:ribosomal protein L17